MFPSYSFHHYLIPPVYLSPSECWWKLTICFIFCCIPITKKYLQHKDSINMCWMNGVISYPIMSIALLETREEKIYKRLYSIHKPPSPNPPHPLTPTPPRDCVLIETGKKIFRLKIYGLGAICLVEESEMKGRWVAEHLSSVNVWDVQSGNWVYYIHR